jgi:hypothetical protein
MPPLTTVAAQAGGAGNDIILFRDDFQDGDTAGWQVDGAWVVQQDGDIYTFSTTGAGWAFVPAGVGWQNGYALRASYLLEQGTLGFSFFATRSGRYYLAVDEERVSLVKADAAGTKTVLTQAAAPETGARHYLVIAKQAGAIQVYVDRTLWLAADDPAPLTAGTIMLGSTDGTTAWVDDVVVNRIGRALPAGAPAVAAVDPADVVVPEDEAPDLAVIPEDDAEVEELPDINHPMDIPLPVVTFTGVDPNDADSRPATELTLDQGSTLELVWDAHNVGAVFLNQMPVATQGQERFEVTQDFNYELEVIGFDQQSYSYYVHVTVTPPEDGDDGAGGPDPAITCQVTRAAGTEVLIHIQVRNDGDEVTDDLTIRWFSDAASGVADREGYYSIGPDQTANIEWRFTYDSLGVKAWAATVTPAHAEADLDPGNNRAAGTIELTQ